MDEEIKGGEESLSAISDRVFDKLNAPEDSPAPVEKKEEPTPQPDDKKGNDKAPGTGDVDEKTLADLKEGKFIPKHRFDEVLTRMKSYESFGSPEELQAKISELTAKIQEAKESGEKVELTPEDREIRDVMLKLFPFLKDLPTSLDAFKQLKSEYEEKTQTEKVRGEAEHSALVGNATNSIKEMAKAKGLDVESPEVLEDIVDAVTRRLHKSKELSEKFYVHRDLNVLKEVFESFHSKIFSGVQRKSAADLLKDKNNQERLPRPPVRGGVPDTEKPDDPSKLSLSQAGDRAYDRISGR